MQYENHLIESNEGRLIFLKCNRQVNCNRYTFWNFNFK